MVEISRGFRRLSVLAALVGLGVFTVLELLPYSDPSTKDLIVGVVIFGIAPAIFVLVLGWVVAGFQKGN
jgi:hypothetical protein